MTEASRVQKLLIEQNAEIDRLKNRIEQLEAANLKQSLATVDHLARIEQLEVALRGLIEAHKNQWHPMKINGVEWFTARAALGEKKDANA